MEGNIICPHCEKLIEYDLLLDEYDGSDEFKMNCPFCGNKIVVTVHTKIIVLNWDGKDV